MKKNIKQIKKDILNTLEAKEICHVCGRIKKPYVVFMKADIFSFLQHDQAREDGPICERCDNYHAMTGEFKDATKEEYEIAKKAAWFSRMMLKWWEKDKKMGDDEETNKRGWGGTVNLTRWCRKELTKNG